MAFKNAVKILISKFGLVWSVLLYLVIFSIVIASLSMPFIMPVVDALEAAGVGESISSIFTAFLGGTSLSGVFEMAKAAFFKFQEVVSSDYSVRVNIILFAVLVVGIAFRFLLGLYEIPLVSVLEGAMSSNAKLGFTGKFISKLGLSCRFTLCKMIYTISFDVLIYLAAYGILQLFKLSVVALFVPFILIFAVILLNAVRYTFLAMWTPSMIVGGHGIFKGFYFGLKCTAKRFASVFSSFIVAWTLIIMLNAFVGIFTLGVGLLITVPISMTFISILNMTVYYGKNGRRYYVDNSVVTPIVH